MKKSAIWPPFTQMKSSPERLKVVKGEGTLLELEGGEQVIDCISSWWVNVMGHAHPKIAKAIYEQAQTLEHVIFAGFTHEPAEKLASKLVELLPAPLSKVFFSDNGSTAVEVALKMAVQYWHNRGERDRTKFLCFTGSYHGDTVGAMSLGERNVFNQVFSKLLFETEFVPYPTNEEAEEAVLEQIAGKRLAAIVIEPLVQGVAGMRMCRPEFLQKLQKRKETLLIYDEVMTGFGRTGDWFACKKSGTNPDIICLAKGLTGGFLPLSVTVCSEEIYQAFYSDDPTKTFFHGHSYTANPLGCAAANATLELLEENEHLFRGMEKRHWHYLERLDCPNIENIRVCGTIAAMDVVTSEKAGYLNTVSLDLRKAFLERGILLRPLGNVLYLMPPYCITDEQLGKVYNALAEVLNTASLSSSA